MNFSCLFLISVLLSFRERGDDVKSQYERISSPSERLKEALDIREMKAAELSERSGINKPSISCYLSGRYEPKQEALYKMGRVLDVAEMWLAGYDIPMERPKEQKNNDAISDIVVKLRSDEEFLSIVDKISKMDYEKRKSLNAFLD